MIAGDLPPGVTLSPEGLLSGTPTATGTYQVTVAASNGLSPADCVVGATGSPPCTPGDPTSAATATRVFTIEVQATLGVIEGSVTRIGTGAPVAGATVIVTDAGGSEVARETTDSSVNYRIERFADGEYTVAVEAPHFRSQTATATSSGVRSPASTSCSSRAAVRLPAGVVRRRAIPGRHRDPEVRQGRDGVGAALRAEAAVLSRATITAAPALTGPSP